MHLCFLTPLFCAGGEKRAGDSAESTSFTRLQNGPLTLCFPLCASRISFSFWCVQTKSVLEEKLLKTPLISLLHPHHVTLHNANLGVLCLVVVRNLRCVCHRVL